mgnify:CR=1 FL=1
MVGAAQTLDNGRSPHGERGLKCLTCQVIGDLRESLSSWRAWIEMRMMYLMSAYLRVALLMESVD